MEKIACPWATALSTTANSWRFSCNYTNCYRYTSKSDFFCVIENAKKQKRSGTFRSRQC